ncbi:uroporphyrinogen decarboxylase family protein [Variovorax rhizosphaerae]|uniref:Uroporphyrinogen decarboxylase family protein n=1 Tax=Variovorax rhizosphaerae TaxID=1836200 RepID=A0ABU8WHJ6_9BURK
MTKMQRFHAALRDDDVDHVPCTAWMHYVTETLGGTEHAMRHARWVRDCNWDICKVVNDFHYPFPAGLETLESAQDMLRFEPMSLDEPSFAEEIKAIRILRAEFGPDMPILMTTFDPLRQVVRRAGMSTMPLILGNAREAHRMLEAVTDTMCRYMDGLRKAGCDGIHFATNSALRPPNPFGFDDRSYEEFVKPYELRMLDAMEGMVRIIHPHGAGIDMQRVIDYPCDAFCVSDRLPGNPGLAQLRELTDKCLMGGIDESQMWQMTPGEVRAQVHQAIAQVGRRKLILSPGCTIPAWVPAHLLQRFREECLRV